MSRRSSCSSGGSLPSSVSTATGNDDPLMRDCFELRKRLQETERSLQNLNPVRSSSRSARRSPQNATADSMSSLPMGELSLDSGQCSNHHLHVMPDVHSTPRNDHARPLFSESEITLHSSMISRENDQHPQEVETQPPMLKKLLALRDENSQLFTQNNRLLTDLESCNFHLHETKMKLKAAESENSLTRKQKGIIAGQLEALQHDHRDATTDMREKDFSLASLNKEIASLRDHLKAMAQKNENTQLHHDELSCKYERTMVELYEMRDEMEAISDEKDRLLRQNEECRTQTQSEIKLLTSDLERCRREKHNIAEDFNSERLKSKDLEDDRRKMELEAARNKERISQQKERIASLCESLSHEKEIVVSLKTQLQSVAVDRSHSTTSLQETIVDQQQRILDYQSEVEATKGHVARLESLVHELHEQSIADKLASYSSANKVPDSGIGTSDRVAGRSPVTPLDPSDGSSYIGTLHVDEHQGASGTSDRAVVADLRLKLAVKEAEIQKLQATLTSRLASNQRQIAGIDGDVGSMDGLRSDLSAIIERCRTGDRKRQELEQAIARWEDDAARASSDIVELEGRLATKMAQISSLENKLSSKNARLAEIEYECENRDKNILSLEDELRGRTSQLSKAEKQAADMQVRLAEKEKELELTTEAVEDMRLAVSAKEQEVQEIEARLEQTKALHGEQCSELNGQLDMIQKRCSEKDELITTMESRLSELQKETQMKTCELSKHSNELNQAKTSLDNKMAQAEVHEKKLQLLESQTTEGTHRVASLESALSECQSELADFIAKFEREQDQHAVAMDNKNAELAGVRGDVKHFQEELSRRTQRLRELESAVSSRQDMLAQSQSRVSELEELQQKIEKDCHSAKTDFISAKGILESKIFSLQERLATTGSELERKTEETHELEAALREVHVELKGALQCETEAKALLEDAQKTLMKQLAELNELQTCRDDVACEVEGLKKANGILAETIKAKDSEIESLNDRVAREVDSAQDEVNQTITKLTELESILAVKERELESSGGKVDELGRRLNESQEELRDSELRMEEIQQALKERQWELRQRATQVTQLDMTFKQQRSELNQKIESLEESLRTTQDQLSAQVQQTVALESQLNRSTEQLKEKDAFVESLRDSIKKQDHVISQTTNQLHDLSKENASLSRQLQELITVKQELTLTADKVHAMHSEQQQVVNQWQMAQRNEMELTRELDDLHALLAAKETDCCRLARELGASQVREAQGEARLHDEVRKLQQQKTFKVSQMEDRLEHLQDKHGETMALREQEMTRLKSTVQSLKDDAKLHESDLGLSNRRIAELEDEVKTLTRELQIQQEFTREANESVVIKQSENARLEAKLSGYERATFGLRASRMSQPTTPRKGGVALVRSTPQRPASVAGCYETSLVNGHGGKKERRGSGGDVPSLVADLTPRSSLSLRKRDISIDQQKTQSRLADSMSRFDSFQGLLQRAADELDRQGNADDHHSTADFTLLTPESSMFSSQLTTISPGYD